MQLTFLGGADEVGASSTLVEIGGKTLLIDAGIRISPRTSRGIQNDQLPDLRRVSEVGGPDAILVTHAHTDHTGALPLVVEQYPHVPVFATPPTIDLIRLLQADAQRIMQSRQEEEGELPLFDELAVERLLNALQPIDFGQPVRLAEGLRASFHPAGHILGASMVVLESAEGAVVFSGDLSLSPQRTVKNPDVPRIKADAVVMESTYGGKLHANRVAEEKRLVENLSAVVARGGKALIPAFALGRAQEVIQIVHAFRDRVPAPVYVDGMVRAVCRIYNRFTDLTPQKTLESAGEDHVFFRDEVRQIQNALQREEIARSEGPAVIVASSGMLTGGASVAYASALAGDPRNAIFLTGYQDEESPGRFLQAVMRRHEAGEEATLRLDGRKVTVRCALGSYSLSAHADEAELIGVADALDADEAILVHGDPASRHSLAAGLRGRKKRVHLPLAGQTLTFAFAPRVWAVGAPDRGDHAEPLDDAKLWEALKSDAGGFYSAAELARAWWGDSEREDEVVTALRDSVYFQGDWRKRRSYQVRTPEQIETARKQRAIMLANPDLVGKLSVIRDSNGKTRMGVVVAAGIDSFEAVALNAKGRHYPADALVWPISDWYGPLEPESIKQNLSRLYRPAKEMQDVLMPYERIAALAESEEAVDPDALLPESDEALPAKRYLARLSVVMALANHGAEPVQGGLVVKRLLPEDGPVEMNLARQTALSLIPEEAKLRKVGMEHHRTRLVLYFDFPGPAAKKYADIIDEIADQTGWDVVIDPTVNQGALGLALAELLPVGGMITKGPSYYMDRREIEAELSGVEDVETLRREFLETTGYALRVGGSGGPAEEVVAGPGDREQMEINAAYGLIREALEPFGLYRVGLKQGRIVLSFITPQLGERHRDLIGDLAERTGYALAVHPHPNQQQIMILARQAVNAAGWVLRKGPGLHVNRAEVEVGLATPPDPDDAARVGEAFEEKTGYKLVIAE